VKQNYKFLGTYRKFGNRLARNKHLLFASEVTDVNGNWVRYDYDAQGRLTKIHANDGRQIDVDYNNSAHPKLISAIRANGRTWSYAYRQSNFTYRKAGIARDPVLSQVLSSVTQPDGRSWTFNLDGMASEPFPGQICNEPPQIISLEVDIFCQCVTLV